MTVGRGSVRIHRVEKVLHIARLGRLRDGIRRQHGARALLRDVTIAYLWSRLRRRRSVAT